MQDIALFDALHSKMDYLNKRQRVIAQNVANADTPDYKPKDLSPVDFSSFLKGLERRTSANKLLISQTSSGHMNKYSNLQVDERARKQEETYEVTPTGNAVVLEEQLLKASENTMDYTMMTNLYQKNMNLFRIAIGKG